MIRLTRIVGSSREADGRCDLARRVCDAFGFRDEFGAAQVTTCLAAVRSLEREGVLTLPASRRGGGDRHPVRLSEAVPERAGLIRDLSLDRVTDVEGRRVFNEIMAREHPRGAVRHVCRQMRYLVNSGHGCLGGFLFTPAMRVLRSRDEWIGWDRESRGRHLHLVVNLARFLVRPSGCRYLASHLLKLALRRMAADFERQYGLRPVLAETYVDPAYAGTCFKAHGWRQAGMTAGRIRRDEAEVPKAVFVRPLASGWRRKLGVAEMLPGTLDAGNWSRQEFGGAPLSDARLCRRLVECATVQARLPSRTFFSAAAGDRAMVRGYYRLIDHPDHSVVNPETILARHRQQTLRRMSEQKTVLLIQDGTDLNFAACHGCEGLGKIGRAKGGSGTLGLHLHSTLAVGGIPLGVARIEFDAPDGLSERMKPVSERKTGRWLRGLEGSVRLAGQLDQVRVVAVCDREADIFDMFRAPRRGVALLIRARHNRRLGKTRLKLFERLRQLPVRTVMTINVDRQSARRSTGKQKAGPGRNSRRARLEAHWDSVTLPVPGNGCHARDTERDRSLRTGGTG